MFRSTRSPATCHRREGMGAFMYTSLHAIICSATDIYCIALMLHSFIRSQAQGKNIIIVVSSMEPFDHQQWSDLDKHYSPFLFASPDGKRPSTARKVHIRRLRDILHLSIQRGDLPLARRAFGLLARCEEIEWVEIWKIGLIVVLTTHTPPGDMPVTARARHIEFLRAMMLQHPEERESLVQELVLSLALAGREREALDELELYLPSPPYHDNAALHTYAGLLCLRLALFTDADFGRDAQLGGQRGNATLLREAQQHLERAHALDPEGVIAQIFIHKLATLKPEDDSVPNESDDDMMEVVESTGLHHKRIRI